MPRFGKLSGAAQEQGDALFIWRHCVSALLTFPPFRIGLKSINTYRTDSWEASVHRPTNSKLNDLFCARFPATKRETLVSLATIPDQAAFSRMTEQAA